MSGTCSLRNITWNHSCLRNRPRGVTVSTLDSESSDRGSNPREVSRQILKTELKKRMQHCTRQHHRLCFNASVCGVDTETRLSMNSQPIRVPLSFRARSGEDFDKYLGDARDREHHLEHNEHLSQHLTRSNRSNTIGGDLPKCHVRQTV